ncbi:hypothetical protein M433DRAFT_153769 [Acidomyces richmondensis BFW]|nr:MAG: hypothetical protein FE78DRAFT_166390 [Acidomyces sp. 'richmondensis']KYG46104.1 hypothetical protein M433DRAFT_153769 [Acidomyces richmondensis BFW]
MDIIQDWASSLLSPDHAAAWTTTSLILSRFAHILTTFHAYVTILLSHLGAAVSSKPDLATLALILIIIFVSLRILDMLWQTVKFWVRMIGRLAFWGIVLGVAVWMWTRGAEGVMEDVGFWAEKWEEEYEGWKERERIARAVRGSQMQGMW